MSKLGFMGETSDSVIVPAHMIPAWNIWNATQKKNDKNVLINCWGGLGDEICAEPAIRYGIKTFKNLNISLAARTPEIFKHLRFEKVYDTKKTENYPDWDKYLTLNTIVNPKHLFWQYLSHMLCNPVDFTSISLWRMALPISERQISLPDFEISDKIRPVLNSKKPVIVVHAGKHWQSKTFPKSWWDETIKAFIRAGFVVALIGKNVDENVGFVPVDALECIDLRDQLSIQDFLCLLKNSKFVFSNDSSPIHAAAAGDAFIGFVATLKHPDFLMHWRNGVFGYKTKNFGLDGAWNHVNQCAIQETEVKIEVLPDGLMEKILPNPSDIGSYFGKMI